jgi:hypothetical protein
MRQTGRGAAYSRDSARHQTREVFGSAFAPAALNRVSTGRASNQVITHRRDRRRCQPADAHPEW